MCFETNLILTYESITDLLEQNVPADVFLLDQAKAFDKMSHCYLMIKLSLYQIENDAAQWIQCFLFNRIQIVNVYDERGDCIYSTLDHINSGVPQGTKLHPTLFNLCINDTLEVVKITNSLKACF